MQKLPFELIDAEQFQSLILDLMFAEGCSQVIGSGTGPDQGKDILLNVNFSSIFGDENYRFLVECKHKSRIHKNDFAASRNALALHQVDGLLFVTSGVFSGTVVSLAHAIKKSPKDLYVIELWDGAELSRRLRKYPRIIRTYFYSDKTKSSQYLPKYTSEQFFEDFGVPSMAKAWSMDTFPITPETKPIADKLSHYSRNFLEKFPPITLLEGGVGSGKSGFSWTLLNLCQRAGKSVASIDTREFTRFFFDYHLENNNFFLPFSQVCENVDILFLDDIGRFDRLMDDSNTQKLAAQELVRIIRYRITGNKPTVIAISPEPELGTIVRNYIEKLKREGEHIDLGNFNLFFYKGNLKFPSEANESIPNQDYEINILTHRSEDKQTRFRSIYTMSDLAYEYLLERLNQIESLINDLIRFVATPIEEDEEIRKQYRERRGLNAVSTRDEDTIGQLLYINSLLQEYRQFYSSYLLEEQSQKGHPKDKTD